MMILSVFISCQKDQESEKLQSEFYFQIAGSSSQKNTNSTDCNLDKAEKIILTILHSNGDETKYVSSEVKLYNLNGSYISQKLSLKVGSYMLTEFYLIDSCGSIIYAAPMEGSLMAQNVSDPLPISFNISKDIISPVTVEVLSTEGLIPADFGFVSFPILNIQIFSFLISVCEIDNNKLLTADLTITSGEYKYIQPIDAIVANIVTIRNDLDIYTLTIVKPGYLTYTEDFVLDELEEYSDSPLMIELEAINLPVELVARYSFNGNAVDNSGNGLNGEVCGPVLCKDRNGKADSAYWFDGVDDYISIPGFGSAVPKEEITISLWAKTDIFKAQFALILYPDYNSMPEQNRLGISINYNHNGINHIFWDFGWTGQGGNAPGRLYVYDVPFDTEWHHYAFTSSISRGVMKMYKDGVLLYYEYDPLSLFDTKNKELRIGSGDKICYFNGSIEELYIFKGILSKSEIQYLYSK